MEKKQQKRNVRFFSDSVVVILLLHICYAIMFSPNKAEVSVKTVSLSLHGDSVVNTKGFSHMLEGEDVGVTQMRSVS